MNHIITWSEIGVNNLERAMTFYKEVLGVSFKQEKMDGLEFAMFEADDEAISGALVAGEGYKPGIDGTVVYFNAGSDLSEALNRAAKLGSKILVPKTAIHDGECGFFAQFIDCEGNRVGLYSKS